MKQPLMIIPPAQAEALYDFALEGEQQERHKRAIFSLRHEDDWDDGAVFEPRDTQRQPGRDQAGFSRPKNSR